METVARATGPGTRTSAALVPAHVRPPIKEEENQLRESIERLPPPPQEPASANLNLTGDLEVVLNRLRRHYGLKAGKVSDGMVRALRERDDENGFRGGPAAGHLAATPSGAELRRGGGRRRMIQGWCQFYEKE